MQEAADTQQTIAILRAQIAELKAKLRETYTDAEGNVWVLLSSGKCGAP